MSREQERAGSRDNVCAQTNRISVTASGPCCARERAWPCEHPHCPACNLLHTQALQAKVCSTTAAHPQRMLRSNIKGVEVKISLSLQKNPFPHPILQPFSEELRSRASSTKQHSAGVFNDPANLARHTRSGTCRRQSQSLAQTKEEHGSLPFMFNCNKLVLVSSPRPNARAPSTPNSSAGAKHITRKLNQTARTYCQPLHNHPLSPPSTQKHSQH